MSVEATSAQPMPPDGRWGSLLRTACAAYAMVGAFVFVGIVAMSVVSITGRKLWNSPVQGDVEMLQMFAAAGSAAFFAWCHLSGGDVKVDFFTARLASRHVQLLDAFGSMLVALFGGVLAWRSAAGALVVREAGERSMLLDWPLWVPQAAMVPGFALLALAGAYTATRHVQAARHGERA